MSENNETEMSLKKVSSAESKIDSGSSEKRLFSQEFLEKLVKEEKIDVIGKLLELEQEHFHREKLNEIEFQSKSIQKQIESEKLEHLKLDNEKKLKDLDLDNDKKEIENKSLAKNLENENDFQPKEFYFRWVLITALFTLLLYTIWLAVTYVTIGLAFILLIVSVLTLTAIVFVILKDNEDKKIFGKIIEKAIEASSKIK